VFTSNPLSLIYWIKAGLGIVVALVCVLIVANLITGIGIALMAYVTSDRIFRQIFINKVDKPSTVTKTGIGVYILTWLFFWALFFTLLNPPA